MEPPLILAIVLPLIFGFLSGLIAKIKNRSVPGWFFAGVLLGPFGLLVIFFPRMTTTE